MINNIIKFFKSFNRYENNTEEEILNYINPSIELNQYKIFKDKEITGFLSWAFLDDKCKNKFVNHGIITATAWNSGDNLCFVHLVCKKNIKNIINWAKKHFGTDMKYNKEVVWLRISDDINKIMRINNKWVR